MRFFSVLSIRYKILSIAVVAIVGFGAYFAVNFSVASANAERLEHMRNVVFPALERSEQNLARLKKIANLLNQAVATEEEEMVDEAVATVEAMAAAFNEIAELDPDQAANIKELQQALSGYFTLAKAMTLDLLNGAIEPSRIQARVQGMQAELQAFSESLTRFRDTRRAAFNQAVDRANEAAQFGINSGVFIGIVLLVVLAATALLVAAGVMRSITGVSAGLKEIAGGGGDLTRRLEAHSQDELGQLVAYFNTFMEKLQGIIGELQGYAEQVGVAADQIAPLARIGRESMERQRADTIQVASASNEMAATVTEVARNTEHAAGVATEANDAAQQGNTVINEAVDTIHRLAGDVDEGATAVNQLSDDSENIGAVLDVIRGIAEQTNLLALNAAIEAARAGEHGRGFAVVADEVRTLAGRTQESTQEIQAMIEGLQTSAGRSVDIISRSKTTSEEVVAQMANAGEALRRIAEAVNKIEQMNTQIASATEEQSSVAAEIDKSITSISRVTEENTEHSSVLAQSSEDMAKLADGMKRVVAKFRV